MTSYLGKSVLDLTSSDFSIDTKLFATDFFLQRAMHFSESFLICSFWAFERVENSKGMIRLVGRHVVGGRRKREMLQSRMFLEDVFEMVAGERVSAREGQRRQSIVADGDAGPNILDGQLAVFSQVHRR